MGQTLDNGIYLPSEGERNCYDGLASNWTTLDSVVGGYRAHVANENIHITSEERSKWDNGVTQAYVLRYANTSLTALGTVAFSALDNTDNVKIGDKVLDSEGKLFALTAVDTANSTATLSVLLIDLSKDSDLSNYYTKTETDNLLNDKADDANVLHKTGNETAAGVKTFSSPVVITSYPSIRMYMFDDEWDVQPAVTKQAEIRFTDKNSMVISYFIFQHRNDSELYRTCWRQQKLDGSGNYFGVAFNYLGNFYPENNNAINLGTPSKRWKDVNSYLVNGINPGALFLPQDRSARVDIAAYFTNTGDGDENLYTAPANGYIFLDVTSINKIILFSQTSNQQTNYAQTLYGGSDGRIYSFFPVRKNDLFKSKWYTGSAASVTNAFFIPCQGNV